MYIPGIIYVCISSLYVCFEVDAHNKSEYVCMLWSDDAAGLALSVCVSTVFFLDMHEVYRCAVCIYKQYIYYIGVHTCCVSMVCARVRVWLLRVVHVCVCSFDCLFGVLVFRV